MNFSVPDTLLYRQALQEVGYVHKYGTDWIRKDSNGRFHVKPVGRKKHRLLQIHYDFFGRESHISSFPLPNLMSSEQGRIQRQVALIQKHERNIAKQSAGTPAENLAS